MVAPLVLAGALGAELLFQLFDSKELNADETQKLAERLKAGEKLQVTTNKDGKIKVNPVSPKNNKPYLVKENKKYIPEFKTKMPPKKYAKGGGIKRKPARKAKIAKVMKRKTRKSWLVPVKTVIIQTVNVQGA